MWKQCVAAAALVALAGGCEERSQPTSNGTVSNNRTTDASRSGSNNGTTPSGTTSDRTMDRSRDTTGQNNTMSGPGSPSAAIAQPDTMFLQAAVVANRLETDLAKMAMDKSQNSDVRAFAQQIGQDHADNAKEAKDLCDRMKVKVPSDDLQPDQKQVRDQLTSVKGTDFDQLFVKTMIEGHQKAIAVFEQEASQGQNADLKQFAQQSLPTLRNHLSMARDLRDKLSGAGQTPGQNADEDEKPKQPA